MTSSANLLVMPAEGQPLEYRHVAQIVGRDLGLAAWGSAVAHTSYASTGQYAHVIRNRSTGGHLNVLHSTSGASLLAVTDSGVTIPTLNVTTLTVTTVNAGTVNATTVNATTVNATTVNATTVNATRVVASTVTAGLGLFTQANAATLIADTATITVLGSMNLTASTGSFTVLTASNATIGALVVSGISTLQGAVTAQSTLQVNGSAQVGTTNTVNHFYIGKTTFQNAAGTTKQLWVDAENNRVIVGSDTALSAAADDKFAVVGGRAYIVASSSQQALGLRYSTARTATYYLGVTDSTTPSLLFKDTSGDEVLALGDSADTYQLVLTGTGRATGNLYAAKMAVNTTAVIGTAVLYAAGDLLTSNTFGLRGKNASGTTSAAMVTRDSSDITNLGDAGDATLYARAGTLVGLLLGGNFELRVTPGGSQFGSPTGGYKGTGTVNAVGVYDDNTLLTDHLLDLYHDGAMRLSDVARYGPQRLYSIPETREYTARERHLPSLPGRDEWASGSKSLGEMTTRLWDTAERLQFHIYDLHDRLTAVEGG